jgi:hypothetical protein
MKKFAWINTETEYVENIIVYDGETELTLPPNTLLVEFPDEGIQGSWSMLSIGWKYMHGQFVEPPQPEPTSNAVGGAPNVIA